MAPVPFFSVTPLPAPDLPDTAASGPTLAETANVASILSLLVAWRAFYLYKKELIDGNSTGARDALFTEI